MTTLNYKISICNLNSREEVRASLENIGLICELTEVSPTVFNLNITSTQPLDNDDILALGSYIGTIQTAALA